MSLPTLTPTYFDIEIVKDGVPTGRYINRGTALPDKDSDYKVSNSPKYDSRLTEDQFLYCVPGIQYKFSANRSIDKNLEEYKTDDRADNFTYRISKNNIVWEFGDGTTSTEYEPTHTFDTAGEFTIRVILYDMNGIPRRNVYTYTLVMRNYLNDEVIWDSPRLRDIGIEYAIVSIPFKTKLRKTVSWQNLKTLDTITMYASGSNSIPGVQKNFMKNKYAHLQKTWRFVEDLEDPVPLDQINVDDKDVYVRSSVDQMLYPRNTLEAAAHPTYMQLLIDNSLDDVSETTMIGTSGHKDVYYIDDTAKNYLSRDLEPVFLFAALSSTGDYGEGIETPTDVMPVKVTYQPATSMRISTNGMRTFAFSETLFVDSEYTLNIAALSEYNVILKSDYEQFRMQTSYGQLQPYEMSIQIVDDNTYQPIDVDIVERDLGLTTHGSGNVIINPKQTTDSAKLKASVKLIDPPYSPIDTNVYVLTDMHDVKARFLVPGFADPKNPLGAKYGTLADNTYVAAVDSPTLTSRLNDTDLPHSCFAVAVDPGRNVVYIANESNDTISKYSRSGELLNDELPLYIPKLICQSGVLNQQKFRYDERDGDSILDYIYGAMIQLPRRFEATAGESCDRFDLNIDTLKAMSPSSLAIDHDGNIWVTLIDGGMTVKITSGTDGEHRVTAIALPQDASANVESSIDNGVAKRTASGEMFWMPSKVVTDMKNDIWVSYTNTENIKLIKYDGRPSLDQNGEIVYNMNQLACIDSFPVGTHLDDMIIDPYNNLWVSNATSESKRLDPDTGDVIKTGGGVYHIENTQNPTIARYIETFNEHPNSTNQELFDKPTAMAIDLTDTLYVATNGSSVVRIDINTYKTDRIFYGGKSWSQNDASALRVPYNDIRGRVSAIDAIGVNSDNRLLIMNNVEKKLYSYVCPSEREKTSDVLDLDDYALEGVVCDFSNDETATVLQGAGDWTGMRWIQKYMKLFPANRVLTGEVDLRVSDPGSNDIVVQNENHDASQSIIDYTLQDTINSKDNLLYWFFKQIVGDIDSDVETLGKVVYSKIANFVPNTTDIDTCNAAQLRSIATQIGCDIKGFNYTYPGSIQRLVDILSIKYSTLFGSRDQTGFQLTKNGYANSFNHGRNVKPDPIADYDNYTIRVGNRIVARELYNNNNTIIEPMAIAGDVTDPNYSTLHGGLSAYDLNLYNVIDTTTGKPTGRNWNWGLSHPNDESVFLYYDFYEYVSDSNYSNENFTQLAGVIDWNNNQTTVNEDSTLSDWQNDGGLVEMIIDKKLRKGLNLMS